MNRRLFLGALALGSAFPSTAKMLTGESPLEGERPLSTWLAAQKLAALKLANADELIQIIFFIDPNCPACASLWAWFDTTLRRNLASLWVPVAYMRPSSEARAVALLRAADPHAALAHNYGKGFDHQSWEGAIEPARNISPAEQARLKSNRRFWADLFGATPLVLYRQADGTVWQTVGLPPGGFDTLLPRLAAPKLQTYPAR
ncbi:MAG: hypothetical protein ACK4SR_09555 [Thiobacillus sp.]